MKRNKRAVVITAVVLAVAMSLSGCGGSDKPAEGGGQTRTQGQAGAPAEVPAGGGSGQVKSSKDTLVIRHPSDNGTIDYHFSTSDTASRVRSLVTNTLLEVKREDSGEISFICGKESLATDYKYDGDEMGITFTLRDGIKFQNGYDMTTEDVIFSIKLYHDISGYDYIAFDQISAKGNTVHVPFTGKNANTLYNLGIMIPVYSQKHFEENGGADKIAEFYSTSAIGTGPYGIKEWVVGDYMLLEANKDYFAGAPIIPYVKIRLIAETSVALMELETGGVDLVIDPAASDVEDVLAGKYDSSNITYWDAAGSTQMILGYNCAGPLGNLKLRQALCYAIDADAMVKTVFGVSGDRAETIVSTSFEHVNNYAANWPYTYDVEKAIELRNEAGYGENELNLIYLVGGNDAARTAIGEMMVGYYNAIGINMQIVNVEKSAWASMLNEEKGWDVHLRSWGGAGTSYTDYFMSSLASNSHIRKDARGEQMLAAVAEIKATMNTDERQAKWSDFQDTYMEEYLYGYSLCQNKDYTLVSTKLKNAGKIGYFKFDFKDAYFE